MNVVVPYANANSLQYQATMLNLQIQHIAAEWREMRGDAGYAEFFNEVWDRGHVFIIVEHDCLPWPGAIAELWACPQVWCGFNTSLQCTKFDPTHLGECPVTPDTHWQQVDKCFWTLSDAGYAFHEHKDSPPIVHLQREQVV